MQLTLYGVHVWWAWMSYWQLKTKMCGLIISNFKLIGVFHNKLRCIMGQWQDIHLKLYRHEDLKSTWCWNRNFLKANIGRYKGYLEDVSKMFRWYLFFYSLTNLKSMSIYSKLMFVISHHLTILSNRNIWHMKTNWM